MFRQAFQPAQLVIELRAGRGIAVGQIKASDSHAIDLCLNIAAMQVLWIAGQGATDLDGIFVTREDRDPIPALLPMPDHAVAGLANRGFRKLLLRRLQLLKARNVGLGFAKPADERRQASSDSVDVVGRYLHITSHIAKIRNVVMMM